MGAEHLNHRAFAPHVIEIYKEIDIARNFQRTYNTHAHKIRWWLKNGDVAIFER